MDARNQVRKPTLRSSSAALEALRLEPQRTDRLAVALEQQHLDSSNINTR